MKTSQSALLALCAASLLFPVAARAKEKALQVSEDNFVSLRFSCSTGKLLRFEIYTVRNHKISQKIVNFRRSRAANAQPPQEKALSQGDWAQLLAQLEHLHASAIAGSYAEKNLADGPSQSLELTLFDVARHKQRFSISSYGHKAPTAFYALEGYLNTLIKRKFGQFSPLLSAR